eukprot:1125359-Prymnesium_polylepis.1
MKKSILLTSMSTSARLPERPAWRTIAARASQALCRVTRAGPLAVVAPRHRLSRATARGSIGIMTDSARARVL